MLEYDGDTKDFEEAFMATFQVSYADVFGSLNTQDLKEGGDHIPVTKDNRQVSSSSGASTTHSATFGSAPTSYKCTSAACIYCLRGFFDSIYLKCWWQLLLKLYL